MEIKVGDTIYHTVVNVPSVNSFMRDMPTLKTAEYKVVRAIYPNIWIDDADFSNILVINELKCKVSVDKFGVFYNLYSITPPSTDDIKAHIAAYIDEQVKMLQDWVGEVNKVLDDSRIK